MYDRNCNFKRFKYILSLMYTYVCVKVMTIENHLKKNYVSPQFKKTYHRCDKPLVHFVRVNNVPETENKI